MTSEKQDQDPRFEQLTSAWRPTDASMSIRAHPLWYDLDASEREAAYRECGLQRAIEAGLDAEGLSTTGRAVLAKILRG